MAQKIKVSAKESVKFIISAMKANLVTMLSGSPGIGKSAIIEQIADQFKLHLIDVRLSQCDPSDLLGFPFINATHTKASYVPMDIFPLAPEKDALEMVKDATGKDTDKYKYPDKFKGTPVPDGKEGFLLFLDEINASSLAVQAASYKLILDKKVGQYDLHPNTKIVAAGNLASDKAIVNRQSTAMQSRLVHLELQVDSVLWQEWAAQTGVDHRIIAYINSKPEDLYKFNPDHNDHTFACPRTWEFCSRIIGSIESKQLHEYLPLLAGTIGEAIARTFLMFTEIYTNMPNINEILLRPTMARLDNDPAFRYGVSHMLAAYAKSDNITAMMIYIDRLPTEFQTITLQNIIRRNAEMIKETAIKQWISVKGQELF